LQSWSDALKKFRVENSIKFIKKLLLKGYDMVIENLIFANHMSILRNMMNGKR